MKAREGNPYLSGLGREGRKQDEETLLDWIVHLAHAQKISEGTIRGKLMAVRHYHIAAGFPDPLELAPRLALALGGLRRMGAKQIGSTLSRWK